MSKRRFKARWMGAVALVSLVLAMAAADGVQSGNESSSTAVAAAGASVHSAALTYAGDVVPVIIQSNGDIDATSSEVTRLGGTVLREFQIIPAIEATVPKSALTELREAASVFRVSLNGVVESTGKGDDNDDSDPDAWASSVYPMVVGADDLWAAGYDGTGVGIAIIDTGVSDRDTRDFGRRIIKRESIVSGKEDRNGHGTHVAGIAAGNGRDSRGEYVGVAPDANIIAVKVGDRAGANIGDVIAGLQWVVEKQDRYNIRVVNLSLTSSVPESYLFSPLDAAVEQAWFSGLVVVVAAGNRGTDADAVDYPPANDPFVITVGALRDQGTADTGDDTLPVWSSRGVTRDGFVKPELLAPGSRLIATVGNERAELIRDYPENRIDRHYFRLGGTSAAAPVVAGIVALILDADPGLTPDQVKARLVAGADQLGWSSAPRVDAFEATFGGDAGAANQGIEPSLWIDPETREILDTPRSPDLVNWDGISWDGISWDGISWDGISWDGISWDGISWDGVTWDGISWDSVVE
jgi:serine protease AprX